MKKSTIAIASLAAAAFVGCNKVENVGNGVLSGDGICTLGVTIDGSLNSTKVTSQTAANESMIQTVQLFAFRAGNGADAGTLDAVASAGFGEALRYDASTKPYSGLDLKCTVGQREIWAVVNSAIDYTADPSVGTKSALLAKTAALADNKSTSLIMLGSTSLTLNPGNESVSLTVRRACASVVLESVKNDMLAAVYRKTGSFRIKGTYLINVPGMMNFAGTLTPGSLGAADWYGKMQKESDSSRSTLIADSQSATVLDFGKSDTNRHTFYSFANDCAPSTAAQWSPRATRLVIEAEYNDGTSWHTCYYPITLYKNGKGLESNKQYKVSLIIQRPGSDSPDKPVEFGTVSGQIIVADWEAGESYTETI